jgi:hypothetical protein
MLEERWKPAPIYEPSEPPASTDPSMIILSLHKKLQRVCGHRGVGRDSHHTDNRKGPTTEATFLHRQLADAYEKASKSKYNFPPPPHTSHGKVKISKSVSRYLTCAVIQPSLTWRPSRPSGDMWNSPAFPRWSDFFFKMPKCSRLFDPPLRVKRRTNRWSGVPQCGDDGLLQYIFGVLGWGRRTSVEIGHARAHAQT